MGKCVFTGAPTHRRYKTILISQRCMEFFRNYRDSLKEEKELRKVIFEFSEQMRERKITFNRLKLEWADDLLNKGLINEDRYKKLATA